MSRLCERPGCSELGAAAYGMVPEDLLFWIAPLSRLADPDESVLCRRHADAMVVPRGWTLDDRRDETPRLFKPRQPAQRPQRERAASRRSPRAQVEHTPPVVEQLVLDGTADIPRPSTDHIAEPSDADTAEAVRPAPVADAPADPVPGESGVTPWSPAFDQEDDLDGLLKTTSPLLARAFRGADRPRD